MTAIETGIQVKTNWEKLASRYCDRLHYKTGTVHTPTVQCVCELGGFFKSSRNASREIWDAQL